jgi:hypothetical protein
MTVSRLLSERDNPLGFGWAIAGLEACGLAILVWTLASARDRPRSMAGVRILSWGALGMMAAALVPLRLPALPKLHEFLTVLAFFGLCLGLVWIARDRARQVVLRNDWGPWRRRGVDAVASTALTAPIAFAGFAQAYIFYARPDLHWVGLAWRARGIPVYLSFAFWEWVTCAFLSLYLIASAFEFEPESPRPASRSSRTGSPAR